MTVQPAKPAKAAGPPPAPPLIREWHRLSAEDQKTEWKDLVEWVAWIHDLYELSREERLPLCWVEHPGLVEELRSLKAWRQFVYDTPGSSTAAHTARSWHGELRQSIAAATAFWAPSCRSGHKPAQFLADVAPESAAAWLAAPPPVMASAPKTPPPGTGAGGGPQMSHAAMTAALQAGTALEHSRSHPFVAHLDGAWWTRSTDGVTWQQCTDQQHHARLDETAARMRAAEHVVAALSPRPE